MFPPYEVVGPSGRRSMNVDQRPIAYRSFKVAMEFDFGKFAYVHRGLLCFEQDRYALTAADAG